MGACVSQDQGVCIHCGKTWTGPKKYFRKGYHCKSIICHQCIKDLQCKCGAINTEDTVCWQCKTPIDLNNHRLFNM